MPSEPELLDVAASVADGTPVDWPALERRADGEGERRLIRSLQMLAQVGDVHDSTGPEEEAEETSQTSERAGSLGTTVEKGQASEPRLIQSARHTR